MNIQNFDFSVNLLQAILWQYNKATSITTLLTEKQDWYSENQTDFWNNWYTNVFNLITADSFGLSVWAYILDLPLFLNTSGTPGQPVFGFSVLPFTNNNFNFGNGNFSSVGTSYVLSEEEQRLILRLRFYQITSNGTLPEINYFLSTLFNNENPENPGPVWVLDGLDMTITYVFDFAISNILLTILKAYDLLPRPAAVGIRYVIVSEETFGFNEIPAINNYKNFTNGNFFVNIS